MSSGCDLLPLYLHLARASGQRRRPLVRDKLLVLAGALAAEGGMQAIGARCRERVLSHNPGHLLGHYDSFDEALTDEPFQFYLRQLRRSFAREKVEHLLESLGIQTQGERAAYFSDEEYAAALLVSMPAAEEASPIKPSSAIPRQATSLTRRAILFFALLLLAVVIALSLVLNWRR